MQNIVKMLSFRVVVSAAFGFVAVNVHAESARFLARLEAPRVVRATSELRVVWASKLVPGLVEIESSLSAAELTERLGAVKYVEANQSRRRDPIVNLSAPIVPEWNPAQIFAAAFNDPMYSRQWALTGANGIHAEGAWQKTGGEGIRVAVLDTGIDNGHEDLVGAYADPIDEIDGRNPVGDTNGHGSHVSAIIAARTNNRLGVVGIAPRATIVPVRTVPDDADETDADLIRSFEYAVDHGARVANCSFGKSESGQAVGDVIAAAGERGLVVVVAAGNDGIDLNFIRSFPTEFNTPNMVIVGASGLDGDLTYFSNYGRGRVDVAAPGEEVLSAWNGNTYRNASGTSMAAPQVSGVVALMLAANPALKPARVKAILRETVDVRSNLEGKVDSSGLVNASKAVAAAIAER